MRRETFLCALVLSALFVPAAFAGEISWKFETKRGQYDQPVTKVSLVAGREVFVIASKAPYQFHVVPRGEFNRHDIPKNAVTGCTGWWAGAGEDYYVVRRDSRLLIYQRTLDEQAELGRYTLVKRIQL